MEAGYLIGAPFHNLFGKAAICLIGTTLMHVLVL
jgi:hypothetical protein